MALINCQGCNNDVSDDAKTCPTCGHPLSRPKGPSNEEFKKPFNALSVGSVVVVCLGCGLLCSPIYRLFVSAQVSATKSAPLSNVKKIGDGLALYVADNDDLYPSRFSSTRVLKEILGPYLTNDDYFVSYNPDGSVMLPNKQLQSYPLSKVVDQKKTVAIYESNLWPEEGKYYGFVDTHARFLKSEEGITFNPKK